MTVIPGPRSGGEWRPWFRQVLRLAMWAGHYSLWLIIPWIAVVLTSDLLGRPGWGNWTTLGAWAVMYGSLILDERYHSAQLCERCAAATPLDPQAAVARWRPALQFSHRPRFLYEVLISVLAWGVLTDVLLIAGIHAIGLPGHHAIWAYLVQDIPGVIAFGSLFVIFRVHRDLQPWCPWCHWDDGGDEEIVPDPDPEDHGAPLPA